MPSKSKKQHNFMAAVANNPKFAKKAGVPQSVGEDYLKADKGRKFSRGGEMATKKVVTSKLGMLKSEQKKGYSAAKQDNKAKLKSGAMDRKTYKTAMQNVKASQKKDREDLVKTQPDARKKTVQYMDVPDKKPGAAGPKKPGGMFGRLKEALSKKASDKKPGSPVTKPGPENQGTGKVFKTPESKKPGVRFGRLKEALSKKASDKKLAAKPADGGFGTVGAKVMGGMGMKRGGKVKCMAGGGYVRAADGITKKGKTKGKLI